MPTMSRAEFNALIKMLLDAGVMAEHLEFDKQVRESSLSFELPITIKVKRSHFLFKVGYSGGTYDTHVYPGLKAADIAYKALKEFSEVITLMKQWATAVGKELAEPDPWLLLGTGTLPAPEAFTGEDADRGFNARELRAIKQSMEEIRKFLLTEMQPNPEHLDVIDERLRFLEDQARSQSKKQWAYTAIGVVVTIADSLAMSPDQTHKLFTILSETFRHVVVKLLP